MSLQKGRVSGGDCDLIFAPSVNKDIQSYSQVLPNLD